MQARQRAQPSGTNSPNPFRGAIPHRNRREAFPWRKLSHKKDKSRGGGRRESRAGAGTPAPTGGRDKSRCRGPRQARRARLHERGCKGGPFSRMSSRHASGRSEKLFPEPYGEAPPRRGPEDGAAGRVPNTPQRRRQRGGSTPTHSEQGS